jgi:hypothetical protein
MRYGDESEAIGEWLVAKITADAVLPGLMALGTDTITDRVYDSVAQEGSRFPVITFQVGDWDDVRAVGPDPRLFVTASVQVKAIDQAETYGRIRPIARRLVAILNGSHNTTVSDGGIILTCLRRRGVKYPEQGNGLQYRHLGAVYEITTQ